MECILRQYWEIFSMLAWTGRYYSAPFTGSRGVMQEDPLSPTIFNMVVEAVIHHWDMRLAGEDAEPEGFRMAVQNLSTFFYADDGFPDSPWLARLQEYLDIPIDLFDRVGLQTNIEKAVGIIFQICWSLGS